MQQAYPAPTNLRTVAARVLHEVLVNHTSLATSLPPACQPLEAREKALVQELVYGSCRWYYFLRENYQPLLNKPIHRRYTMADPLLVIGAYQLIFMRTAAHAAINESVAAADELGLTPLKGMINAILRKLSLSKAPVDLAANRASHPQWMLEKLQHNWPEHTDAILEQNNHRPPMTLRVNILQVSRDDYLEQLSSAGIEATPCRWSKQGIQLNTPCQVTALPGFAKGLCSVQDEAAQLCTELLALQPGQRVLDACAAPGGKSCAMLEREPLIDLTALDSDATRAQKITENLERLNLKAGIKVAPAETLEQWWDGQPFDRILLDAPCSATGVIRRHPDIKLLRRQSDLLALAEIQLKILTQVWKTLATNGTLVYATCSIFPQENSRIIERFLKQEPSAKIANIDASWGIDTGFGRQLFPLEHGHDGFFYACLRKSPEH